MTMQYVTVVVDIPNRQAPTFSSSDLALLGRGNPLPCLLEWRSAPYSTITPLSSSDTTVQYSCSTTVQGIFCSSGTGHTIHGVSLAVQHVYTTCTHAYNTCRAPHLNSPPHASMHCVDTCTHACRCICHKLTTVRFS